MKDHRALTRLGLFPDVAPNCHYCGRLLRRRRDVADFPDRLVFVGSDPHWEDGELVYVCEDDLMLFDHAIPRTKSGRDERANLVPVCGHCNCSKGARFSYTEMVERRMDQ